MASRKKSWPVKVSKAQWSSLSQNVKRAKERGEVGAELRAVVVQWEGRNAPLRWGMCATCGEVSPVKFTRNAAKCILCGSTLADLVGDPPKVLP